ncbi:SGNH/GDSL hydrolase family protein [Leeuwenhoekiella marinoflava]|uniref:SGNH/GDSL hydrolase family protein n=1 Tax=Leeuwenhoekiella marinoflava TaxID=988 RepID=UPI0030029715
MSKFFQLSVCIVFMVWGNIFKLKAQDWPNLKRYAEANEQVDATHAKEDRVVFMGNSITEGWVNSDADFFTENNFIGRGISGQTTPQMLLRFRQDVIDLDPVAVVILAGTNDIAGNTGPMTNKQIFDNIVSMAELAEANGIKVIISSILPAANYPWKPEIESVAPILKINTMLQYYCEGKGFIYLDYFSEMANEENGLPEKFSYDGVHPTEAGYKVMEPLALEAIGKALRK